MLHEVTLQLPLARKGPLPLTGHPVLDPFGPAAVTVLDHPVNPERGHLLLAARWCCVHGIDHTTGQGRQETFRQQAEVRLINQGTNVAPLIQAKIGNHRPGRTIVAKHRHRIANLVQWRQQVAPGRIKTHIDFVTAVLLAFGEHTGSLGAIDVGVTLPLSPASPASW
ncbi:hypothetical protein D3C72_1670850 [compost metagenome]